MNDMAAVWSLPWHELLHKLAAATGPAAATGRLAAGQPRTGAVPATVVSWLARARDTGRGCRAIGRSPIRAPQNNCRIIVG
jgi:hypothetical protein